ncbi:hypothetical protein VL15_09005 [Burkholderia cepacia]|uniref:Uncharacterized protein n=1 Tax=Burkholderia cepacia TaxID=292 RepID=A0A0J6A421_BURCE|nr:hypothetical protein [Burkholderia cepacia]KML60515.1 hypothetical protein VL15_09005 [Burkholderia cepacia]
MNGTGTFNAFQQDKRSGLLLAADTSMVVGAKKDMGTNALIKPVLPHNENLLKPRPQDLQGIFVSPHEPEAALELQRQYASIHGGAELPFMTYDGRSGTSQVITPDAVRKMIKT